MTHGRLARFTSRLSRTVVAAALGLSLAVAAAPASQAATATNNPAFTANVMAPLKEVQDWAAFDAQLATAKTTGVDAVSVDVWWGQVEAAGDNSFNWTYYDSIFSHIKAKGLKIVPVFSFHTCGSNVGDDCYITLPSWLSGKYANTVVNGVTLGSDGLKYKSEQGRYSNEALAVWADSAVQNEYRDFTAAFASHFGATYANDLQEINVSLGPSGELRYPSYNAHDDNAGFPTRGSLQSYSDLAKASFRSWALAKYSTLAGVNAAWGINLASVAEILPPSDAPGFFQRGDYKNTAYGRDFVDWYNGSLTTHGTTVLNTVASALGGNFSTAAIGYKVPGVHWAMTNPAYPRAAEVAAGLVQTSLDLNADATAHGYDKIIKVAKSVTTTRKTILHFTCLEMANDDTYPNYSQAQNLVFWVANGAAARGVQIKGENALSAGVQSDAGWDHIVNAFDWSSYTGLTILRLGDVSTGTGQYRLSGFIKRYRAAAPVTIHVAEFESASGYTLHAWGGLTADLPMTYEGYFNGKHWWQVTVTNPPSTFQFCFTNTNGHWDGANRTYGAQGINVYTNANSAGVATLRP